MIAKKYLMSITKYTFQFIIAKAVMKDLKITTLIPNVFKPNYFINNPSELYWIPTLSALTKISLFHPYLHSIGGFSMVQCCH